MKAYNRCEWCGTDPLYQAYHDNEWGKPSYDDRHLFAMLCLEGMQAGLSGTQLDYHTQKTRALLPSIC